VSFLAVGFVPFRIRASASGCMVPEVLPLGTYSWSVNMSSNKRQRYNCSSSSSSTSSYEPLLCYDVISTYCKDKIHVFNYVQPHATLNCYSPLSSLIPCYNALLSMRELSLRGMVLNSKPNLCLEEQEKVMINSITDAGSCITHISNPLSQVKHSIAFFHR